MKLNNLFLAGTALFALAACVNNDDKSEWNDGNQAISFNASIQGLTSRASGTQWATGDRIGIYMKANGAALNAATDVNKQYTVSENGTVSAASANDALYYPTDKSAVDFVAYYPYQSALADNTYKVNVADQTNQPAIDLLYSNNATNVSSGTPSLTFTHQLSQIVFNLTKDNTIASLNGLTIKFTGMNTKADFTLTDGKLANAGTPADINALVKDNEAAIIAIPAASLSGVKVEFNLNGTTFTADYPEAKLEGGKKYTHKVLLKDSQGKPTVEFGTATITDWTEVAGGDINVDFGSGSETPEPTPSEKVILNETFDTSEGTFTIKNVTLPEGSTYVWKWSTYNDTKYMKASAYINKTNKAAESWLISPDIDLTSATDANLAFDHCHKFGANKETEMTLWITESSAENWTQLTIPTYGTGNDYNYVTATVSLKAYAGKKVKVAFKYVSTTSGAPTWQINDVKVTATENGGGSGTVDPTPDPTPKPGVETILYEETLGTPEKGSSGWPYADKYTGYTDTHKMTITAYSTSIRNVNSTSNIWFPKGKAECYFQISGFNTTNYSNLKLSYQITSDAKDVDQKGVAVETDKGTIEVPSANITKDTYQEISLKLQDGMTYLKFSNTNGANNFRVANIKVVGTTK